MEPSEDTGSKKESCSIRRSSGLPDYRTYCFSIKDGICFWVKAIILLAAGGYFFYHSPAGCLPFAILLPFYYKKEKKVLGKKRQSLLRLQFKEAILSVCVNLKAGYAVENAFAEAEKEMRVLYGKDSLICNELGSMVQAVHSNVALEKVLVDFGRRSGVKEIEDFSQVFAIGKRSSGDIPEIVEKTAELIGTRIEVKREIETVMSAKVLEQKAMSVVPFAILSYVGITSPGFFAPLYHNPAGIAIMTGCLLLYLVSLYGAEKIMEIEV